MIWTIGSANKQVSEGQIRGYVLCNDEQALSFEVLQIIAMDYLNKCLRKVQKFDKWPKDLKDLCASKGIIQDKQTGLPVFDGDIESAWSQRAKHAEMKLEELEELESLVDELQKEADELNNKQA